MATIRNFKLIVRNSGRSISDLGWAKVEPKFIETWKSAVLLLRERELAVGKETYTVSIDLTAALRRHERYFATMRYIHRGGERILVERMVKAKFPRRPSENSIKVTTKSKKPQSLSVAESVVHDTFLMLNISAPGCCDFYKASLIGDKIEPNISLSNTHFESALLVHLEDGWPDIHYLKFENVLTWFSKVRQSGSQLPTNPMERVLFALLHLSKIDMSPMEVVWLFYAFESLLQTRTGENFSSIVKRLCLLLEADSAQSALVKRKMRDLYDIRSAIIHGGFEITHPMHNEGLDKRVQDTFVRMVNATGYGHAFLLSAIQKTIVNGWKFPKFDEVIRGSKRSLDEPTGRANALPAVNSATFGKRLPDARISLRSCGLHRSSEPDWKCSPWELGLPASSSCPALCRASTSYLRLTQQRRGWPGRARRMG